MCWWKQWVRCKTDTWTGFFFFFWLSTVFRTSSSCLRPSSWLDIVGTRAWLAVRPTFVQVDVHILPPPQCHLPGVVQHPTGVGGLFHIKVQTLIVLQTARYLGYSVEWNGTPLLPRPGCWNGCVVADIKAAAQPANMCFMEAAGRAADCHSVVARWPSTTNVQSLACVHGPCRALLCRFATLIRTCCPSRCPWRWRCWLPQARRFHGSKRPSRAIQPPSIVYMRG